VNVQNAFSRKKSDVAADWLPSRERASVLESLKILRRRRRAQGVEGADIMPPMSPARSLASA
jgi:hypothetical protein